MRAWLLLAVIGLPVAAPAAYGQLPPAKSANLESVEAMVLNSDSVVVGKILELGDGEKDGGRIATISVEETLRGDHVDRRTVRLLSPAAVVEPWKNRSCRLLLVLKGTPQTAFGVLDLDDKGLLVLSADLTLLRKPDEVVRVARAAIRRMPGVKAIDTFILRVPAEAVKDTKWSAYYRWSHWRVTLAVPVDERLEQRALELLRDKRYRQRLEGLAALRFFKSDDNIACVMRLLADPDWSIEGFPAENNNGLEVRYYDVRAAAYQTLIGWGIDVAKPTVKTELVKSDMQSVYVTKDTDEVYARLRTCKDLRVVGFGCEGTDAALKKLATLTQIERLSLSAGLGNYGKVTNAGLAELQKLTNLKQLDLHCPKVTDAGLKALAPLKNLTALDLQHSKITGAGLNELEARKNITYLHLHMTRVTDAGLKGLRDYENLTYLSLYDTRVTDAGMKELAPLKKLTTLYLGHTKVTGLGLKDLAPLRHLQTLHIDNWELTDASLQSLREVDLLHTLPCATAVGDARPRSAADVISLNLWDALITDAALKHVPHLKNLSSLNLNNTLVTDAGLKELAPLRNLATLNLYRTRVTDAGLKELAPLKNLTLLHLPEPLTDARLRVLREIDLLHALYRATARDGVRPKSRDEVIAFDLSKTLVTDAGLPQVRHFKNLATLHLQNTEVTDAGLTHLSGLTELRDLTLGETKVTNAGVTALKKALPKCRISTRYATSEK